MMKKQYSWAVRFACLILAFGMTAQLTLTAIADETSAVPESGSTVQPLSEPTQLLAELSEESTSTPISELSLSVSESGSISAPVLASSSESTPISEGSSESTPVSESSSETIPAVEPEKTESEPELVIVEPTGMVVSGLGATDIEVETEFDFLQGVSVTNSDAPEGTTYRVIVTGVTTPEGGTYTYSEGDSSFTPAVDDMGLIYTITYAVQQSTDGNATWTTLPDAEQPINLLRELTVVYTGLVTMDEEITPQEEINGIDVYLQWGTTVEDEKIDGGYTGASTATLTPQAELTIATGGEAVYAIGAIKVRVPLSLYAYRNGTSFAVPIAYGCPLAPAISPSSSFNYTIDTHGTSSQADDEIVFTNYRVVSGQSNHKIQWSYSLIPLQTVDMTVGHLQATVTAENTADPENVHTDTKQSEELTYTINTQVGTMTAQKEGQPTATNDDFYQPAYNVWKANASMHSANSVTGSNTETSNYASVIWGTCPATLAEFNQYYWQTWRVRFNAASGNQPSIVEIQESLPAGAVIYNVYSTLKNNNTAYTIDGSKITCDDGVTADMIYITVRYPKALITETTIKNDASVNNVPIDHVDPSQNAEVSATTSTTSVITGMSKNGSILYDKNAAVNTYGMDESDWDADNYLYVVWNMDTQIIGHPAVSFYLDETMLDGGEIMGVPVAPITPYTWDGSTNRIIWKDTMDALHPFNSTSYNGWSTSSTMDRNFQNAVQYRRYSVLVRYPKTDLDEQGGKILHNTATATVHPTNTMLPDTTATANGTVHWLPYQIPINTYATYKTVYPNSSSGPGYSYGLTLQEAGEDIIGYYSSVSYASNLYQSVNATVEYWDNDMKLVTGLGGSTQFYPLDKDDYAITSITANKTFNYYDITKIPVENVNWVSTNKLEGQPATAPQINLYLEIAGTWQTTAFRTWSADVNTNLIVSAEDMPANVTGYKFIVTGMTHSTCSIGANAYFTLKGNSPTVHQFMTDYPTAPNVQLRNDANSKVTEGSNTLSEINVYNGVSLGVLKINPSYLLTKNMNYQTNDTVNRQVDFSVSMQVQSNLGADIYNSTTLKHLYGTGQIPGEIDHMRFYDLLPQGMDLDTSLPISCMGSQTSTLYQIENTQIIEDYRGSGRTMVIIDVKYLGDEYTPNLNNASSNSSSIVVNFHTLVRWENLRYLQDTGNTNLAACQPIDNENTFRGNQDYATLHKDTVSPDGKTDGNRTPHQTVFGMDGVTPVFNDLNEDGNPATAQADTLYTSRTFNKPVVNTSLENGLTKWVRATGDANGGGYGKESAAQVGNTYDYNLNLQNTDGGTMKDVVIYDIFEEADGLDETGAPGAPEVHWKGSLVSVNTLYPRLLGIDVKVWYTTASLTYDTIKASYATKTGWSTTKPASGVTAIAIDLSMDKNGVPYVFAPEQATSITVRMRAPSTWVPGKAFNRACLDATTTTFSTGVDSATYKVSMRTATDLYIAPVYEKTAVPAAGTTAAAATEVGQGNIITYTIRVNPGVGANGANDYGTMPRVVTVSDQLPVGLQLVNGSISQTINGGTINTGSTFSYNAATRTITWPTYTATTASDSTFTFRAYVTPFTNTATVTYANRATINNGGTNYYTNYTYHVARSRYGNLAKSAALVPVGGSVAGGVSNGSATSPVATALGQTVEYTLTFIEYSAVQNDASGHIVITDTIPDGCTYVAGSATPVTITKGNSASEAMQVGTVTEITDSNGKVTGLSWTIDKMWYNDRAVVKFRVTAPTQSDDPSTPAYESVKVFTNTGHFVDEEQRDATAPETVTVVNADGTTTNITAGNPLYLESAYSKDSNITYHQVTDPRYKFIIRKNLQVAAVGAQQFVFNIHCVPTDTSIAAYDFQQIITVASGATSAQVQLDMLEAGTYTVTELDSNWRYEFVSSSNTSLTLNNTAANPIALFTNRLKNDHWEDGHNSVINTMPGLVPSGG